jgi:hypothetical protein
LLVSEEDKFRFGEAIRGDHLFCPFQCELCHFINIQGRSPVMGKGSPRRYGIDEMFEASELGCFLEPITDHHKTELGEGKSVFTDRA